MPWCPKCQAEYREGYTKCADCGSDLVDMPKYNEQDHSEDNADEMHLGEDKQIEEVLLANVNDSVALSYITSMLEDAEIPYRVIAKDLGDYLQIITGSNFMGSCIYVASADLNEAQDILESYNTGFSDEE